MLDKVGRGTSAGEAGSSHSTTTHHSRNPHIERVFLEKIRRVPSLYTKSQSSRSKQHKELRPADNTAISLHASNSIPLELSLLYGIITVQLYNDREYTGSVVYVNIN